MASAQLYTNPAALARLSESEGRRALIDRIAAEQKARALGMPVSGTLASGAFFQAMRVEDGKPVYYITDNAVAADSMSTDEIRSGGSAGLSLSGTGVTLLEWDGGTARTTHQEFGSRVTNVDGGSIHWHSTHVAGTMVASGVSAPAKGMAPAASLRSFDWNSDTSEMAAQAALNYQVSNHSYGRITGWYNDGSNWYWYGNPSISATEDYIFGYYDSTARAWDNVCYNAPYLLPVKSAGNDRGEGPTSQPTGYYYNGSSWVANTVSRNLDGGATGYDTIGSYSGAKNVLTVGAVNDRPGGYTNPASITMSSFSCYGPMDDGRIKPDIVANGVELTSTYSSANNAYAVSSGTSMSTPAVSGSLGLLIQHYADTHAGGKMLGATMKALVLHTADECGAADGPDYRFGWGMMNSKSAAQVISDDVAKPDSITENTLTNGGTNDITVYSDGTTPLRVTIAWTDPQGTVPSPTLDNPAKVLVNDLDLRVIKGATTYQPWVLDKANPANAATTGDNSVDNVEQILIPAPTAGSYTIRVNHKGSLSAAQAYAMIITGHSTPTGSVAVSLAPTTIIGGGVSTGTVTLSSAAPGGGAVVSLDSSDTGTATVPATVTVPAGQTTATFPVTGAYVLSSDTSDITATYIASSGSATITVNPRTPTISTVTVPYPYIDYTMTATVTVTLDSPAPAGGVVVNTFCSNTWGTCNPTVTVPAGSTSATYDVWSTKGNPSTAWGFKANAKLGSVTKGVTMALIPMRLNNITFSPATVQFGKKVTVVVRALRTAPPGGWTVALSSSSPALVPVPATVTIPQGASLTTFQVTTGSTWRSVYVDVSGFLGGYGKKGRLYLNP